MPTTMYTVYPSLLMGKTVCHMMLHQASLLITSLFCIVSVSCLGARRGCPPSSCGDLQDIRYPFRLKGVDPPACGDPRYEFICEDNKPILEFYSAKYHVQSVYYGFGAEGPGAIAEGIGAIQITDAHFAAGSCALPSQTLTPDMIIHYDDDRLIFSLSQTVASFINCTKEIQGDGCVHIPCLSGINESVYVAFNSTVAALAPSCRFLAMVPTSYEWNLYPKTEAQVFSLLQKGFNLSMDTGNYLTCGSVSSVIKECLLFLAMVPTRYEWMYPKTEAQVFPLLQKGFNVRVYTGNYLTCGSVSSVFKECLLYNFYQLPGPSYFSFSYIIAIGYHMSLVWLYASCPDLPTHCPFNRVIFVLISIVIGLINALFFLVVARLLVMLLLKVIAVSAFLAYKFRQRQTPLDGVEKFLMNQKSFTPARFAYMDVIVMTRNFKDKLGQGGFGSVYKGELPGGFQVAVKMLGNSKCNGDDFISEVSTIGMIHHINIVRLVGFCSDGSKRALVYEYLAKGSLDKYIFSANAATQRPFTWEKLTDIALGVARGIDYLHGGCTKQILHFDIKPHNILLDNSFSPKVSDFGLAKLFPKDHSMVALSVARGTIGYIAPELISRSFGIISHKSDVYSFGMLLLEMAGGRRNVDEKVWHTSQIYYPSWIYDQLNDQKVIEGKVDSIVEDVMTIGEVEKKLSIVGLWCIQTTPYVRPSMYRVIEMLQAEVDTLQMPPKPFSAETISSVPIMGGSMENSSTTLTSISEDDSLLYFEGQHLS